MSITEEELKYFINLINKLGAGDLCVKYSKHIHNKAIEEAANKAMIKEWIPKEDQSDYDCEKTGYTEVSGGYVRDEHYVEVSKESILKLKLD